MCAYGEGPYGGGPYGYASPEMVRAALKELAESNAPLDSQIHSYINEFRIHAEGGRQTPPSSPMLALNQVITEIDRQAKEAGVLRKGMRGLSSFILTILDELRRLICGKRKTPTKLGAQSQAVLSAVAALIAQKLGVANPTALGIAVLVLITLGQATKNAFCKMTDGDVLKAFRT